VKNPTASVPRIPAIFLATVVFPHPGGPVSKTFFLVPGIALPGISLWE
jgi:hypothetical protein